MNKNNTGEIIQAMPKIELHLHLEGAFPLESLLRLIQKYGSNEVHNLEELRQKFVFTDFAHFIETWYWKSDFYREPSDIEDMAYSTIASLSLQNIIYAEVYFSPFDFIKPQMPFPVVTEAVISGVRRAESEYPIRIGLIADIVRNHGHETALARLDKITQYQNEVLGIGLGGSEKEFPAKLFAEVYTEAQKRGFRLVAHAGEADGPNSIWDALRLLHAERIGHGVRAVEDPNLMEYLRLNQIPLEVCVTSNLKTKIFNSAAEHPVRRLFDYGLLITINSDDPTMFGSNLTDEFNFIANEYNFTLPEIKKLTQNAIQASFAEDSFKQQLTLKNNEYWNSIGVKE